MEIMEGDEYPNYIFFCNSYQMPSIVQSTKNEK